MSYYCVLHVMNILLDWMGTTTDLKKCENIDKNIHDEEQYEILNKQKKDL